MAGAQRSPTCTAFRCFLCWILNLLINVSIPFHMTSPTQTENLGVKVNYGYCSTLNPNRNGRLPVSIVLHNGLYMFEFIVSASGSMVVYLLRHKQRVQHINSQQQPFFQSLCWGESRIYHLDPCEPFCSLYSLSALLSIWMSLFAIPGQWLVDTSIFLSLVFPNSQPLCAYLHVYCHS